MQPPLLSPTWDPRQFPGLRRWSLLIFVAAILYFICARIPIFTFTENSAYQSWESFYEREGQDTQRRWPANYYQGVTFDQQMILEIRKTYDPADLPGSAPGWLYSLRQVASVTTHFAEGIAVVAALLILALMTRFIPRWKPLRPPIQGAFFGAITAGLLVQLLKIGFGRGRPNELIYRAFPDSQPFSFEHSHHSLPSGHAAATGVMVLLLCVLFPRWSVLWCSAGIWLCATRVLTAEHWPSDTLPGVLLGALCTAWWISRLQPQGSLSLKEA